MSRMFDLEPTITLPWLIRLRWLFVVGQAVVWCVVRFGFGSALPWWPFAVAIGVLSVSNVAVARLAGSWPPARVTGGVLVLDTALLTVQLAGLGGATNPFVPAETHVHHSGPPILNPHTDPRFADPW